MALTKEEVNRMEEQADLHGRFNRAADRFVLGGNLRLRAAEREQELRDREADILDRAHRRFMRSKRNFVESNPHAVSREEYAATMGFERGKDPRGLFDHELDILKQQGENEFKVAEQKRFGMKEQGADAAGLNAEATKYGWNKQLEMERKRQSGLTEREKMIGDRTERIAGMEHGTIGPDGKVIPGSRERVANINADSAYDVADRQGQAAVAIEREKGAQMAAANIREEQVLRWKQQHEKELAEMRLNNMIPDEREMRGLIILQQQPENKGKSIMQILKEFREASK